MGVLTSIRHKGWLGIPQGAAGYFVAPILNIFVPQTGHEPWVAGRPFFIVMTTGSLISRFALHFTQ